MTGRNDPSHPPHDPFAYSVDAPEPGSPIPDAVEGETIAEKPAEPVPKLPDDATPEEKELHWFRYVYQGDRIPQLTLRAVLMGGILGMFMSISNLYTTLKLGWSFGVAITACVLSYAIWNTLRQVSGHRLTPMTILENNCMQSTAAAAGASTGGTVGTAFGALLLITGHHVSWTILLPFVFLTAALGVFLAIPMKRQMINIEQLRFPSGIAAAETLRSLHGHGGEAIRKAYSLLSALLAGGLIGIMRGPEGALRVLDRLHQWTFRLPDILLDHVLNPLRGRQLVGLGFEPGTLMIAAGAFVGLRVSLSMLAGSILLYYVVTPWLLARDAIMAGTAGYIPSFEASATGIINPTRWALWGGTSIMVFSSLASIAVQWRTIVRSFNIFGRGSARSSTPPELAAIEVPVSWLVIGVIPIGIGLVVINYLAFKMSIVLGAIAVAMSFVTSLVCSRATGETDTTPTGAMGKLTQLLYALLARDNRVVNLMSAGVTAAAGGSAADLLTDLKSGYLLGANPRKQFIAQFSGIFFGVAAIVPAWYLMVPDKAALEAFNPPATNMWRAVAELLAAGLDKLPVTAQGAIVIGALIGIALPILTKLFPKAEPYMPSAMGLGLSWVVLFQNSLSFAIGAVLAWLWTRRHKASSDTYLFPIAAGLIAGESVVLALIAIAATLVQFLG